MTQEDKELLLKDLCSRLPYGVVGLIHNVNCDDYNISITGGDIDLLSHHFITIKPYLRPMSSMTEEEFVYFMSIRGMNLRSYEIQEIMSKTFNHPNNVAIVNTLGSYSNKIDWLNKKMFDWRGLIPMNLALEAPEGMYNINK